MGDGRGRKLLRFVVCFIIALLLMILTRRQRQMCIRDRLLRFVVCFIIALLLMILTAQKAC